MLDALAMCEVKRDCSDLGVALVKSHEVLAWLSGEREAYVADEWANKFYPSGHFGVEEDGVTECTHACKRDGVTYVFDRRSFARFRRGSDTLGRGRWLHPRLHLVTSARRRAGDATHGTLRRLCSRAHGRLQHRAARDLGLLDALLHAEAADAYDWETLRCWLREAAGPLSPYGALQLFAADEAAAERLHVQVPDAQGDDAAEALGTRSGFESALA